MSVTKGESNADKAEIKGSDGAKNVRLKKLTLPQI